MNEWSVMQIKMSLFEIQQSLYYENANNCSLIV